MSESLQIGIACMTGVVCGVPIMIFLTIFGIPIAVTAVDAIDSRIYERRAQGWTKRMDGIKQKRGGQK